MAWKSCCSTGESRRHFGKKTTTTTKGTDVLHLGSEEMLIPPNVSRCVEFKNTTSCRIQSAAIYRTFSESAATPRLSAADRTAPRPGSRRKGRQPRRTTLATTEDECVWKCLHQPNAAIERTEQRKWPPGALPVEAGGAGREPALGDSWAAGQLDSARSNMDVGNARDGLKV
ncbi:hypothetical protein HPB48_018500 [Haemaphysalis longicornis]|uniref:Uncharacterized protein n=1 Tax=Haemaphysalis longicornis TaxID=44386 RepID=A0A9J6GT50_HAELO|nr:hypothetical protein HPB48_018500 [Haemaphysalis longicornis]